jgi:hypothetical protein
MPKKLVILPLFFLFAFMIFLLGRMALLNFLPKNPGIPYLVDTMARVPDTEWTIGFFQPVFLFQYERNGSLYLKTVYRNSNNNAKIADVFVGGKWKDIDYSLAPYVNKDEVRRDMKFGEFDYPIELGKRFKVEYLIETNTLTEENRRDLCSIAERLCKVAEFMQSMDDSSFLSFWKKGEMVKGRYLPALGIYKDVGM